MFLLKSMIKKRAGLVSLTVIIRIFSLIISLWWNAQISFIINSINLKSAVTIHKIIIAAITVIITAVITYAAGLCLAWTSETMAHDLRMGYANYFTVLDMREIENLNAGEQLSKLQNEIDDAINYIRGPVFTVIEQIILFTGTFIWLIYLNPSLTLLANIPVVFLVFYTVFSSRIINKTARQSQQANAYLNGFADTLVSILPVIRLFDASDFIQNKYNIALKQAESANIKEERRRAGLMSVSGFLSLTPLMLLFLIGGTQIIQGSLTIGTLYIFVNLSGNISGVMMNMPAIIAGFRRFAANMDKIQPSVLLMGKGKYK